MNDVWDSEERIERVIVLIKEIKTYEKGAIVVFQDGACISSFMGLLMEAQGIGVVHKLIVEFFVMLSLGTVLELVNVCFQLKIDSCF